MRRERFSGTWWSRSTGWFGQRILAWGSKLTERVEEARGHVRSRRQVAVLRQNLRDVSLTVLCDVSELKRELLQAGSRTRTMSEKQVLQSVDAALASVDSPKDGSSAQDAERVLDIPGIEKGRKEFTQI